MLNNYFLLKISYFYYHPNRLSASPCTSVRELTPAPGQMFNQFFTAQSNQFFTAQSNQFIGGETSNQLMQATQGQNASSFLFQQHRNANIYRTHFQYILSANTR